MPTHVVDVDVLLLLLVGGAIHFKKA